MIAGLFAKLLFAIILGAAIGMEREGSHQGVGEIGGMRTYALIALMGALAGVFFTNNFSALALLLVGGFSFCSFRITLSVRPRLAISE